jgi:hypothetical protein
MGRRKSSEWRFASEIWVGVSEFLVESSGMNGVDGVGEKSGVCGYCWSCGEAVGRIKSRRCFFRAPFDEFDHD